MDQRVLFHPLPTNRWARIFKTMHTNHIGMNLRIFRRANGLTRDELAKQSGVHYNTIVQLENLMKVVNQKIQTLERLSKTLKVKITELIDRQSQFTGLEKY